MNAVSDGFPVQNKLASSRGASLTAEALQRFKPVRMVVNSCPHCGGMHLYSMNEGHLKVWDEYAMHDAGRVA